MLTDISSFLHSEASASKKLGQILGNSGGISIMYHSIWSITMPTCHILPPPPVNSPHETEELSDAQYARLLKFLTPSPAYKSKLTPPTNDIDANFYLVGKDPYDPTNPPFEYMLFERSAHISPDVLWFEPYSKNPSALNHALTLGLLIETGDFDGVTLPLPNINMSHTENNSMYLQGTIPLSLVLKYIPSLDENNRLRMCKRKNHDDYNQPVTF